MSFVAFPKIEHIFDSSVVDDDCTVSANSTTLSFDGERQIVIQEKLDGTNVSVHFETPWQRICQKRSGLIGGNGEAEQYRLFERFCDEHLELLNAMLGEQFVLFGEFLWTRHSVAYNRLPAFFMAFDVFDKTTHRFLATNELRELLAQHDADGVIHCVPTLATLRANELTRDVVCSLASRPSQFATDVAVEGVVVRVESLVENRPTLVTRYKYRRRDFAPGVLGVFHKKNMAKNRLASDNDDGDQDDNNGNDDDN